jgi:hypothetical protein
LDGKAACWFQRLAHRYFLIEMNPQHDCNRRICRLSELYVRIDWLPTLRSLRNLTASYPVESSKNEARREYQGARVR